VIEANKPTKNQEDRHMQSIAEKAVAEQSSIKSVTNFFTAYGLGAALKNAGAYKQKGIAVTVVVKYLISLIYTGRSMFQDMRSATPFARGFGKDTVYRLLNMASINWQAFQLSVASNVVSKLGALTSEKDREGDFQGQQEAPREIPLSAVRPHHALYNGWQNRNNHPRKARLCAQQEQAQ